MVIAFRNLVLQTCSASARPLSHSNNSTLRDMAGDTPPPLVITLITISLNWWDHRLQQMKQGRRVIKETTQSSILRQWELNKVKCWRVVMTISLRTSFWWGHHPEPSKVEPNNERRVIFRRIVLDKKLSFSQFNLWNHLSFFEVLQRLLVLVLVY